MKRLKRLSDHTLDRLSVLPDSLIHEILSFLNMRDVVRTAILSKRWKNLWTTVPCLEFSVSGGNSVQDRNFVSRTLSLWRGTQLRKFSINFFWGSDALLTSDLDMWVLFAKDRKVEDLSITYEYDDCDPQLYCPPQCLYECSSVTKLKLDGCDLQNCRNVQWHRLNSLELSYCRFSENVIGQVFSSSSSPQLETFQSFFNGGFHNLSIRSSRLKKLIFTSDDDDALTIWAPKVEALKISGIPFNKYSLTDVSSLTNVDLDIWSLEDGNALCQILPAIQHVTTVGLSDVCLKILGDLRGKYSFPPLLNVKVLRIGGGVTEISELLHLFEVFPKVKMLVIDWKFKSIQAGKQFNAKNYKMSEACILESNLLQLKTVEITLNSFEASLMLQFIEFLLKHATVIEKIVIQTRKYGQLVKSEDVLQVARQMLSLQRSFPSVELIL